MVGGVSGRGANQSTTERAPRTLTVKPGDYHDTCPLCGIHRQNAGFLRETCGDGYLQPDCFIEEKPDD